MMIKEVKVMKRVALYVLAFCMTFGVPQGSAFAAVKVKDVPRITKVVVYDCNHVKLQWSRVKHAVKYKLYRKKDSGDFVLMKTTKYRNWRNRNLAYGTRYTYIIKAVFGNGKVKTSKVKTVYTKPAKPVISVRLHGCNRVVVIWPAAKGAVTYKVYRKKNDGRFILRKTTTKRVFTEKELAYGTRYTYKVKAVSRAGKSEISAARDIVTEKKPVMPEILPVLEVPQQTEIPVIPEEPADPDTPDAPTDPEQPLESELPEEPAEPEAPQEPEEPAAPGLPVNPKLPEEKTITIRIPVYAEETVYWIRSVDTGEILYETTHSDCFEQELLLRPDPDTWHWGSGGVQVIKGYETMTMTETEWESSWYHDREDVIVMQQDEL